MYLNAGDSLHAKAVDKVYVDGTEVTNVIELDTDEKWVRRYTRTPVSPEDGGDGYPMETLQAKEAVTVSLMPGYEFHLGGIREVVQ